MYVRVMSCTKFQVTRMHLYILHSMVDHPLHGSIPCNPFQSIEIAYIRHGWATRCSVAYRHVWGSSYLPTLPSNRISSPLKSRAWPNEIKCRDAPLVTSLLMNWMLPLNSTRAPITCTRAQRNVVQRKRKHRFRPRTLPNRTGQVYYHYSWNLIYSPSEWITVLCNPVRV